MATIHDLIEVTQISPDTTYSRAAGNVIGVVDNVTSAALDDGEFDIGDSIRIGGQTYSITRIREASNSGRFTLEDGTSRSFDPGSESNLPAVFLTVSDGSVTRHFIIPNDSYGDMRIAEIRTGSLTDVAGSDAAVISTTNNTVDVVCFVTGARIRTATGETAVEAIRVGDLIATRDNGLQPVRAILRTEVAPGQMDHRLKPVAFEVGSLGPGLPHRRLCVSPHHRMLVTDPSGRHVLAPAKALTHRHGVRVLQGKRSVSYFHIVFSRHEIIWANGAMIESFYPGPMALRAMSAETLAQVRAIFGSDSAADGDAQHRAAAPALAVPALAVPALAVPALAVPALAAPVLAVQAARRRARALCGAMP
ncbi:MAG: Hint domain-containing protein [Rhodobacterales bacterium]|nr:Hint domain-containing protein [Rhodobacterales bacterium]